MIDTTKAKADAEEGLRIAGKATEGPIYVRRYDNEGGYLSFQLTQGYDRGENSVALCEFDDLDNPRAPLDAAFYADSRTRAPEAYRNVIEMAGVIDRLLAERSDLESRFAEVSADHRDEHKRLVSMGVECDNLRAQWDAGAIDREARMIALRDLVEENGKLRAEVARLGAPGATMDGAPQ